MFNEIELAEHLRERRGFRILDVTRDDVPTIVAGCAGARVVIGVEGSNLAHGLITMQTGGALVTLQPPDRFSGVLKRTTDMAGMDFAFVVGQAEPGGFRVDPVEVERTLDLLPQSSMSSQPAS
jgi:capsular polysaccharide biosynthesis protein